jgi:hypothetical protein
MRNSDKNNVKMSIARSVRQAYYKLINSITNQEGTTLAKNT